MFYSAFGLSLAADWQIPGLMPRAAVSQPDIRVWLAAPRVHGRCDDADKVHYVSDGPTARAPALRAWKVAGGAYFRLRYADDTEFLVDRNGREVWAVSPDSSTLEDTATYLLGPVLGFALRLRGITCLHASVVDVGGRAIAIAGRGGTGKSTAAAFFSALGHPVLADDIAALIEHDGVVHVQPAYPQLRLWPDSVAMLYGSPDALPRLTPTWDKRALLLSGRGAFQERSLPLAAVYVLGARCEDKTEPTIEAISGAQRLVMLLGHTYAGYLLDPAMRRQEFESLARLASSVPVCRLIRPGSPTTVAAVCARILEDCERRGCIASPTMVR